MFLLLLKFVNINFDFDNCRYGMLKENRHDNMEMRPLSEGDDDDDDDDMTLFERRGKR